MSVVTKTQSKAMGQRVLKMFSDVLNSIADDMANVVTGVKGNNENAYRKGDVNLTAANVGAATADHTHDVATSVAGGFMSANDKIKADSYPTLPSVGDSDCVTFLCGNGEFDHPHTEYGAQSGGAPQNYTFHPNQGANIMPNIKTDKYGHITSLVWHKFALGNRVATTTTLGYMSAADKVKLDAYPSAPANSTLQFQTVTLGDGTTASVLTAVANS